MPSRPRTAARKAKLLWIVAMAVLLVAGAVVAYHFLTLGSHSVVMIWAPSPGATSYNVYRSPVSGGPYAKIGVSPRPSYVDKRVPGGILYYMVTAVIEGHESKPSNEVQAFIPES